MAEASPDTLVDRRYRIESRIGSGGMAEVYCAHDLQLDRDVALKLLHRRFSADQEFVERFRREASSAAGLSHPNVVGVYDRGEWDDTYYIAMEYLPGRSLKQVIRDEAPLEPLRAIDLTTQILRAARFAHRRGIIHRDLKPHNVIVDDEDRIKVTDFGIARAGASDMTETGSIMGTAQYLSPEQAQGHAVAAASDLYSVGVVLYEMLSGRLPFEGDSAVSIALKHLSEEPAPPTAYNPAIPTELEAVVMHALEKDPGRRFGDADSFLAALSGVRERIAAGLAPVGPSTTHAPGVPLPVPVGLPLADGDPSGEPPGPPDADEEPVADEPSRRRRWLPLALALLVLALIGAGIAIVLLLRAPQIVVPNEVGKSESVARTALQNRGFQVSVIAEANPKPKGIVFSQSPRPGNRADKSSTVTLTVSSGPEQVAVPDVVDSPQQAAERTLRKRGLRYTIITRSSSDVQQGFVLASSPPAGTQVDRGSKVKLVVSSGVAQVTVPDVTGSDTSAAEGKLANAGLKPAIAYQASPGATAGTVISQDPGAGAVVPAGSTVTLTVARAPKASATARVPGVTGDSQDAAVNAISAAGLSPRVVDRNVTSHDQDGKVISQSPSAGQTIKRGGQVTIVVGRYRAPPTTTTSTTPTTTTPTTSTPTTTGPNGKPPKKGGKGK